MSESSKPNKATYFTIKDKLLKPSLTSQYVCYFSVPPTAKSYLENRLTNFSPQKLVDRLSLACSDASLPGSSLATHEINNDYTGVTERHAYRRLYDERMDFSFYVDSSEYYVIKFFESWIGYTVNEQYVADRNYSYRANFPNDYCVDTMTIIKFEKDYFLGEKYGSLLTPVSEITQGKKYLKYQFIKAFPISIASMPVSYEASQLLKCTVSFTYSRYILPST